MDIKFSGPLTFLCEVIESDDHLPSIKFRFYVEAEQFSHKLKYSGEVWIKCDSFDLFIKNLIEEKEISDLEDINGNSFVKIKTKKNETFFLWSVQRKSVTGSIIASSFESAISDDELRTIKSSFLEFPKWW